MESIHNSVFIFEHNPPKNFSDIGEPLYYDSKIFYQVKTGGKSRRRNNKRKSGERRKTNKRSKK
jgi:hypothetical protein